MKLKMRHKTLAILLAVTIILGVSLPLIATASDDTSGGFEISMYWNMSDNYTSADKLSYNYNSTSDETKALRLAVRYQNKNMGDAVYAPGEVVLTVPGIGGALRGGTKEADSIAADKASDAVKTYAWSYTYSSETDTYTFTNNKTLSSEINFAGSFEILWSINSRESVASFSRSLQAELRAAGGVSLKSNTVSYSQTRLKDEFTILQKASRIYTAEGYEGNWHKNDYWWVEYEVTSGFYMRSLGVKSGSFFEVLLPEGAAIVNCNYSYTQTGTETVGGITYNIWRILREATVNATLPIVQYVVRYDKNNFPATAKLQNMVRSVGEYNDFGAGNEVLASCVADDLQYGEFEFIPNPPGNIFSGQKTPTGTGYRTEFARDYGSNTYNNGYINTKHFVNGGGTYSYSLYGKVYYGNVGYDYYDMVLTDDAVEAETVGGVYRQLGPDEFHYRSITIPNVYNVLNANKLPIENDYYPVEIWIKTSLDGAFTLYRTTTIKQQVQNVELPENTCGYQIKVLGMREQIDITFPVYVAFHVGEDSDLRTSEGVVYNTMVVNLYGYNDTGSTTKDDPHAFTTLYYYAELFVLQVPHFYHAATSLEPFGETQNGALPSRVTMQTHFDYKDDETLSDVSMYTILPKGMTLPFSVVDLEAMYDILEVSGLGMTKSQLLQALTIKLDKNYRGSGRTYLEFRFRFSTPVAPGLRNVTVQFPVNVTLDDFLRYGPSFDVKSVSLIHNAGPDLNPSRGITQDSGIYANLDEQALWSDLNGNGDTEEFISYHQSFIQTILQAAAMETGISKLVATTDTGNRFVQPASVNGVYDEEEIPLAARGETYQYRLRMAPNTQDDDTYATDIILLDTLETGPNAKWQGELVSIDVSDAETLLSKLNGYPVKATVYYSNLDYSNALSQDGYKPDLSTSDWSTTRSANTKTFAVSFGDAELTGDSYLYVDITMLAPDVDETDSRMQKITENLSGVYYREVNTLAGSSADIWLPSNPVPARLVSYMTTVYIIKTDATDGSLLPGAVFDLYKQLGANPNTGTDEVVYRGLITNARGRITIRSLQAGTYYLVETDAPNGYVKAENPIALKVNSNQEITLELENARKDGTVTLYKTSDRQEIGLAGAVFALYHSDGTLYRDSLTVPDGGNLTVTGLPWGDYYFVETSPPAGYTIPDDNKYEFTISAGNDAGELLDTIRVVNVQLPAKAVLTKYEKLEDGTETTTPIPGASYKLSDAEHKEYGVYATDADGKIYLDDLAFGSYYFQEVVPATGYSLYEEKIEFTVTAAHTVTALTLTTYDQRLLGNIWLQKIDDARDYVPGAVYGLFREGETTPLETGTTSAEGIIEFKNLVWGKYYIREISSPQGYILDETEYPVEISAQNAGAAVTMTVVDNRLQGSVRLIKTDDTGNVRLNGAKFNLYRADGTIVESGLVTQTVNGQDGVIEVDGLDWGSYYFEEQKAPAGYVLSDEKIRFSVNAVNASVTLELDVANKAQGVEITLTKEIAYNDLVFAHGNPTFTFKMTGTTTGGESRTWYRSVTFDKAYADANASGGVVRMSVTFTLPAGTYTATEEAVIRYQLKEIKALSAHAAKQGNDAVVFTLPGSGADKASATFVNEKEVQSGTSGTGSVANIVKSSRKLVAITADYHGPETVVGYEIDKDDITVWAFYDDDTQRLLASHEFTLEHDPIDGSRNGNYTITVVYTERGVTRRAYFDVEVQTPAPFYWTVENGEATIVAYLGDSSIVNFPKEVSGRWNLTLGAGNGPDRYSGTYVADGNTYPVRALGEGGDACVGQSVTQIVIPAGVRKISNNAFLNTNVAAANIADGLLEVGDNAFWLAKLTTLDLPDSVEKIGSMAYSDTNISGQITLPANLVTIGSRAFNNLPISGTLKFPGNLQTVGDSAFTWSNSYKTAPPLTIDLGTSVASLGNYCFAYRNIQGTKLVIPDSLKTIGNYAFFSCGFVNGLSIDFGNGIQSIGNYAFSHTTPANFTDISHLVGDLVFPDTLLEIGNEAFRYGNFSGTVRMSQKVSYIGTYAFSDISGTFTTDLELPATLDYVRDFAFNLFKSTGRLILNEGLKGIGRNAFCSVPNDSSWISDAKNGHLSFRGDLTIPSTVEYVNDFAFSGTGFDGTFSFTPGNQVMTSIGVKAFFYFDEVSGSLILPDSITNIGDGAFYRLGLTGQLHLPESLKTIGQQAFRYAEFTGTLKIPDSMTELTGERAFSNCQKYDTLILSNNLVSIGLSVFETNIGVRHGIKFPDTLKTIGNNAFWNHLLEYIHIPGTVKTIGDNAFEDYNVSWWGGAVTKYLILEEGIENIGKSAFASMLQYAVQDTKVPKTVKSIGDSAFRSFASYTSSVLYLPSSYSPETYGVSASKVVFY